MMIIFPTRNKKTVLALGAESAGNFSAYSPRPLPLSKGEMSAGQRGFVYFSENFGDLLNEKSWANYQKSVLDYLKINKIKPDIILTDLHPSFNTTLWGQKLAKKYKAQHIQVQHHIAHIFSSIGDKIIQNTKYHIPDTIYGIACDGTGYGTDGKIWGGEVFKIENQKSKIKKIERIGHLENQIMIGGDLAIKEPARMLIGILDKAFHSSSPLKRLPSSPPSPVFGRGCPEVLVGAGEGGDNLQRKNYIYNFVKKYYSRNEFELLYSQLQQNFNCQETSSTGRILDAVSVLLGFCGNERNYKHEPIDLLEKNSTKPYTDLEPRMIPRPPRSATADLGGLEYELDTTHLFNYVINYLHKKDKHRLAATAQLYIAEGLYEILQNIQNTKYQLQNTFFAGGIANNKIISTFLEYKGVYMSKKIPRGDAGLSFGQMVYYVLNEQ
jgi:hydrogenase maturation protein HypF